MASRNTGDRSSTPAHAYPAQETFEHMVSAYFLWLDIRLQINSPFVMTTPIALVQRGNHFDQCLFPSRKCVLRPYDHSGLDFQPIDVPYENGEDA